MGDMGEFYRDIRGAGQVKRASNRETSAQYLTDRGISFESKNGGAHLIVCRGSNKVDFWPGTGKWIFRNKNIGGRGVKRLVKLILLP